MLAAIGLGALSPVQQAGAALSLPGAAMGASPALAQTGIPGVGLVVEKTPGNAPILVPSDANGEVRLTGLEPGEYEVKLLGSRAPVTMEVGRDGKLAFVVRRDVKGSHAPRSADPRARRALPVVREWVERCCDNTDNWDRSAFGLRDMQMPDINTGTAEELMAGTNISRKAAAFIVEERGRGGLYKDPLDFAQRVGGSVTVDFGYSSVRIGDTTIVAKGLNPKNPGFKMVKGSGVVEVYGKAFVRFKAGAELSDQI